MPIVAESSVFYYGDNLKVMREWIPDESVDLIYLDPPFNSQGTYNRLFTETDGAHSEAQRTAFEDTWRWGDDAESAYGELTLPRERRRWVSSTLSETITMLRRILRDGDLMAYLTMMAIRLVEMRRALRPNGTLYLHCDPTASHYLKVILDAVFESNNFVSEIVWKRTSAHNRTRRFGPVHDVILSYAKGADWTWNPQYLPYDKAYTDRDYRRIEDGTGRRFRISDLTSNNPGTRELWNGKPPPGGRYWAYAIETLDRFKKEGRIVYSSKGYPQYKRYLDEMPGQLAQDVWVDIGPINNRSSPQSSARKTSVSGIK